MQYLCMILRYRFYREKQPKNVYGIVYKKCLIFLDFIIRYSIFYKNRPKNLPFRSLEKWIRMELGRFV